MENQGDHKQISPLICQCFNGKPKQDKWTNKKPTNTQCYPVLVSLPCWWCLSNSLLTSTLDYSSGKQNVQEYHRLFQQLTSNIILLHSCLTKIQWSGKNSEFCCFEIRFLIIFLSICVHTNIKSYMQRTWHVPKTIKISETWSLWVVSTDIQLGSYFVYLFYSCGLFSSRNPFPNEMCRTDA